MKLKIDRVIKVYSKCATKQMAADHLLKKNLTSHSRNDKLLSHGISSNHVAGS